MRTFTVGGQRCVIADARCWRGTCSLVVSMIELYVLVIVGLVMAAWAAWWVADGWQRRLVLLEVRARDLGAAAALVVDATRCLVARTQVAEAVASSMQPIALAPEPIAVAPEPIAAASPPAIERASEQPAIAPAIEPPQLEPQLVPAPEPLRTSSRRHHSRDLSRGRSARGAAIVAALSQPSVTPPAPPAPPPAVPTVALEERAGKQWATWLGALALLGAGAYYFQLASDRGTIGPVGKLAFAIAAAMLAAILGDRCVRRDARGLGQALLGVGLGLGFGAVYAGFARYGLYAPVTGAAVMVAITALGMTIAVRHDAPAIAFLAVLGGYLTPALASDGSGARDVLCTYLMVLDVGVLGVALLRRWRALEVLAGVGTAVLFAGWYHGAAEPGIAVTLAWCLGFGALFVALPLIHHLRRRIALSRRRIVMAIVAGVVTFAFGCEILDGVGRHLALLALAIAGAYLVVAAITRRRLPDDAFAHAAFATTATAFATLALPLELRGHGLAMAWAIEAPVLLALGARYRLAIVRHLGAVTLALAIVRLFTAHWPLHLGPVTPFLNAELAGAVLVAAAAIVYARFGRTIAIRLLDELGRWLAIGAGLVGLALTLGIIDRELVHAALRSSAAATPPIVELGWWLLVTGVALSLARASQVARWTAMIAAAVATTLAFPVVSLPAIGTAFLNLRFIFPAATCVLAAVLAWQGSRCATDDRLPWPPLVASVAATCLWFLISREAWQHARLGVDDPDRARWLGHAALSCAWSVMAAAALALGFARRITAARLIGLALFGLAAAKVVVIDLARVEQGYRVLSLAVLGVLLLSASWLYHRRVQQP